MHNATRPARPPKNAPGLVRYAELPIPLGYGLCLSMCDPSGPSTCAPYETCRSLGVTTSSGTEYGVCGP